MERIEFIITQDQAEILCEHFNMDINSVEQYQVCEMLDKVIDNLVFADKEKF